LHQEDSIVYVAQVATSYDEIEEEPTDLQQAVPEQVPTKRRQKRVFTLSMYSVSFDVTNQTNI
jgi:hypothetical protein